MLLRDFFIALFGYCFVFVIASITYFLVQNQMAVDNSRPDTTGIVTDFYIIVLVFALTTIVLVTLQNLRQKVQALYVQYYSLFNAETGLNVLKLHTLLLKGTEGVEMSGDKLRKDFEALYPAREGEGSKIIGLSMIPDLSKAFEEVCQEKQLALYQRVYTTKELNKLSQRLLPDKVTNQAKFNERVSQFERRVEDYLSQDLRNSGCAFVCFSSFKALKEFEYFTKPSLN